MPALAISRDPPQSVFIVAAIAAISIAVLPFPTFRHAWVLIVVAPFAEEAAFRAGLQELLLRYGRSASVAILAVACIFAMAHVMVRGDVKFAIVAVPALLLGILYEYTRSVRLCALTHGCMNALWLAW